MVLSPTTAAIWSSRSDAGSRSSAGRCASSGVASSTWAAAPAVSACTSRSGVWTWSGSTHRRERSRPAGVVESVTPVCSALAEVDARLGKFDTLLLLGNNFGLLGSELVRAAGASPPARGDEGGRQADRAELRSAQHGSAQRGRIPERERRAGPPPGAAARPRSLSRPRDALVRGHAVFSRGDGRLARRNRLAASANPPRESRRIRRRHRQGLARLVGPAAPPCVRVGVEVRVAAALVRDVRVQLGRGQVGVAEHLLHSSAGRRRPRAGASRRSGGGGADGRARVPGPPSRPAGEGSGRRLARVSGPPRELRKSSGRWRRSRERPTAYLVAAQRLHGPAPDRDHVFLAALPDAADEPFVQIDRRPLQPDCLAHAEAGAVEELHERAVAERPRRRAVGGLDQALGLAGRERARQLARAARRGDPRRGVVFACADQGVVSVERAQRRQPARDRRVRAAGRSQVREVAFDLFPWSRRRPGRPSARPKSSRSRL